MKKKYILNNSNVNALYNFGQNSLTVMSKQIVFEF